MTHVAIVTGGTRGIGLAVCQHLTALGYRVAALSLNGSRTAAPPRNGEDLFVVQCDVSDFAQCERAVATVEKALGPVGVLVNNAGITRDVPLHKMSFQQWDEVLRVDLYGVYNMCRQVIEGMRERGFGRIVNISSINGQKGQYGQANYCAAKAGVIGFTKALALENARRGITVNAVAPGYTDTDMVADVPEEILASIKASIPVGRLGRVDEIAQSVGFLVSDDAGFITGATLSVNGGQYLLG